MFDIERYGTIKFNSANYDYISNLEYLCSIIAPTDEDFRVAKEIMNNGCSHDDYKGFAENILRSTFQKHGTVFAIAGNIGSGKSTFIHILLENNMLGIDVMPILEDVYRTVLFGDIYNMKVAYGYAKSFVKKKILDYCSSGKNFIYEFVPSNDDKLEILDALKSIGYRIVVLFIMTDDVNVNVDRVKNRVASGADFVSEDKVRSRELLTNGNMNRLLQCSDEFYHYNSKDGSFILRFYKVDG